MKTVGLTYDLKEDYKFKKGEPVDANAEFDSPETINTLADAIKSLGFKVKKIGNVHNLLKRLDNLGVDIVFNIAEGIEGRNRESQVPVILETKGIPYVGSDGLTLALTLDKILTKKLLLAEGIPTPNFFEVSSLDFIDTGILNHTLRFPLIVKPRFEGSSKGINENSLVKNKHELKRQAEYIIRTYNQPALVEEFISGYEFTVAIIGNDKPEVFAPVQTKIDGRLNPKDLFYSFDRVDSYERIEYIFPPKIDLSLQKNIMNLALQTYKAVGCRDFGRVDFRVDEKNKPYVLEINPLPILSAGEVFMVIAKKIGITYSEMIGRILNSALKRYNML